MERSEWRFAFRVPHSDQLVVAAREDGWPTPGSANRQRPRPATMGPIGHDLLSGAVAELHGAVGVGAYHDDRGQAGQDDQGLNRGASTMAPMLAPAACFGECGRCLWRRSVVYFVNALQNAVSCGTLSALITVTGNDAPSGPVGELGDVARSHVF